jgi:predicted DNA-binding WGR domain protein
MKIERHNLRYTDYAVNANKFYLAFITDRGVGLHWGRVGAEGQFKWYPTASRNDADIFARKKLFEKLAKGYEEDVEPTTYEIEDWGVGEPSRYALTRNASNTRAAHSLTDASGDLATQAEAFAEQVTTVINAVRRLDMVTEGELLASITELDADLARAKAAVENAELGLTMARRALGQRMGA